MSKLRTPENDPFEKTMQEANIRFSRDIQELHRRMDEPEIKVVGDGLAPAPAFSLAGCLGDMLWGIIALVILGGLLYGLIEFGLTL